MTRDRVGVLLHRAVYRVIRRAPPLPSVTEFLELPLRGVLPGSSPSAWPSFWKEALVQSVAETFREEGYRIDELSERVFLRWNRKMRSIRDWIAERVMMLEKDSSASSPSAPKESAASSPDASRASASSSHPGPRASALVLLFLMASFCAPALARAPVSIEGTQAFLARTPLDWPESSAYDRHIVVLFRSDKNRAVELPVNEVVDPAHYSLQSANDSSLARIERVVWRGAGKKQDQTTGAVLFGRFDASVVWLLSLDFPDIAAARVRVAPAEDDLAGPANGFVRFVRLVDRHLTGTLDVRTLEGEEHRVGIDLESQVDLPLFRRRLGAEAIHCRFVTEGMFAVDRSSDQAHNALDAQISISYLRRFTMPGPEWLGGGRVHALGLQIAPLGIEADQDFRAIEMPRGFLPPTLRVSYTFLKQTRRHDADLPDRHRLDAELTALVPLLRPLDLETRYRLFHDLDTGDGKSIVELSWKWYVTDDTRTAVLLKLVHGALPPAFRDAEMVGVGFALGL